MDRPSLDRAGGTVADGVHQIRSGVLDRYPDVVAGVEHQRRDIEEIGSGRDLDPDRGGDGVGERDRLAGAVDVFPCTGLDVLDVRP